METEGGAYGERGGVWQWEGSSGRRRGLGDALGKKQKQKNRLMANGTKTSTKGGVGGVFLVGGAKGERASQSRWTMRHKEEVDASHG